MTNEEYLLISVGGFVVVLLASRYRAAPDYIHLGYIWVCVFSWDLQGWAVLTLFYIVGLVYHGIVRPFE